VDIFGLFFGWLFEKLADKAVEKTKRFYVGQSLDGEQLGDIDLSDYAFTSRFAHSERDLQTVLALRRSYFGRGVVAPDDAYRACWRRNPDTMKIVYDPFEGPVGYWSALPTDAESFAEFIRGEVSHSEMLANRCLPWSAVDPGNCYVYIVGAVVPLVGGAGSRTVHNNISRRVILDSFAFGLDLLQHVTLAGITGYPSRNGGYRALLKMGLEQSSIYVDDDRNQPIFFLESAQMATLEQKLQAFTGKCQHEIPKWESEDRSRFLAELKSAS
jgi:hypothetical protein